MKTIYLASGNAHKLHELQAALEQAGLAVKVKGPDTIGGMPEVEETGSTFESNALLKAQGLREFGPSEGWFLADDSGIEIDDLDGRPGVISARYAGMECNDEANNDKVLQEMKDFPESDRTCRFQCVLALIGDGFEETFAGACEGKLLSERQGDGGFGYDPLFLPDESELTFAEISLDEKAKISHRARALTKLIDWIASQ
ncbi:MAG: RdgB/HAM1 family non-canonical purine NTP pyrophosphatase [Opitutae bacterium]|jgi:XTP/dITP diphosphohydrolase|nr:RdgB/HAM1 family non-canonical purine NTP pyrophosphatase [Opitutae bacterium]MBT7405638.1 RdgB/HAM1 family non-canonical purine NTP pyrophosphatase [Opitutae bacterium]